MDILTALLIGTGGAVIALFFEHLYLSVREKRKEERQKLIKFPNSERIINETIFDKLSPGRSVELMKTVLGTPDKKYQDSEPAFKEYREEEEGLMVYEFDSEEDREKYEENKYNTTAYFYDLKNAQVKITSKDGETINSLAVEVKEGTLDVSSLPLGWISADEEAEEKILLGETKVNRELVESSRLDYEVSRYDHIIIMSIYTAAPLYTHYTYTGTPNFDNDIDKDNPESFIGGTITGVCLHDDEHDSYIIRALDNR